MNCGDSSFEQSPVFITLWVAANVTTELFWAVGVYATATNK